MRYRSACNTIGLHGVSVTAALQASMQLNFVFAIELLTVRSAAITYTGYHGTQTGLIAK